MVRFKGAHVETTIILTCVRWHLACPLSYRQIEEMMQERGIRRPRDHQPLVLTYSPQLEAAFHRRKRPVCQSWRVDETYIKVKGQWYYLYRAADKTG